LWLVVDLACALAGNRAHYQYILPMSVSLGVVVGLTYSQQVGVLTGMQSRLLVSALLLSPVLVMYFNNQVRQFVHVVRYGHNLYHDAYAGHDQPSNAEEAAQVSAFIEGMRQPDDTLFSWDINPAIFWRLHIKSPVAPLDLAFRNLFSGEVRQRFVGQVLAGLWSHPPTFIIDSSKPFERQDPLYTDFFNLIDRQYDCVKEFKLNYSHFRLYKRRSSA
jgi:hypothetical protein